jgi:hypothetical protein
MITKRGIESIEQAQDQPPTYALRRLIKRDCPGLAEKVISGEMSANAAAFKAGFHKRLTLLDTIKRLLPKLTTEERRKLMAMLGAEFL